MNPLAAAVTRADHVAEFTIGAQNIDAWAHGVALVGRGSPIVGIRVLAGSGQLSYADVTGRAQVLGNLAPLQPDDEIDPVQIGLIYGTSAAVPSAALTLRARW